MTELYKTCIVRFRNRDGRYPCQKEVKVMAKSTEDVAMMLIVRSGDARTLAFQALTAAREGKFEEAKKLLAQSEEKALKAHHVQTEMLAAEANGEGPEINILLVHSQDHLMTSMLAQELIRELIYLHEIKSDKQ